MASLTQAPWTRPTRLVSHTMIQLTVSDDDDNISLMI
jgi:hypothetical protein